MTVEDCVVFSPNLLLLLLEILLLALFLCFAICISLLPLHLDRFFVEFSLDVIVIFFDCLHELHRMFRVSVFFQVNVSDNPALAGDARGPGGSQGPPDDGKRKARQVDKISRKIFPIAFVIFNLIYWIVYAEPFSGDGLHHGA